MIIGSFLLPHLETMLPEVNSGTDRQINKTIKAYKKVIDTIVQLRPQTIVMITPMNISYDNYFHISPRKEATGNLGRYNAPQVKIGAEYDWEFVNGLCNVCNRDRFPAGTLGEKDPSLDLATMIPLYYLNKEFEGYRIVRMSVSGLSLADHYRMGMYIKEVSEELARRVVVVVSCDLSEHQNAEADNYDRQIMNSLTQASFDQLFGFSNNELETCKAEAHRGLAMMAGSLDKTDVIQSSFSYELIDNRGLGICSFAAIKEDAGRNYLEKLGPYDCYAQLAMQAVETYVKQKKVMDVPNNLKKELINERSGLIVQIYKDDVLYSSAGSTTPKTNCVAKEIIEHAVKAAYNQNAPLSEADLSHIRVKVITISHIVRVRTVDSLNPKQYGIVASKKGKEGIVLPRTEGIEEPLDQILRALDIAGLSEHDGEVLIQRFETVEHS